MPGIGAITGHLTGKVNYISNLSLALRNYTRVFPMDLSGVGAIQRESCEDTISAISHCLTLSRFCCE